MPKATFRARVGPSFNIRQHSMLPGDLPSTSIPFFVAGLPSVNFCELSVPLGDRLILRQLSMWKMFHQLPSTFFEGSRLSINFRQHSMQPEDLPRTFRVARRSSVNFRPLSVLSADLPSNFVTFSCHQETFCQLPSTFRVTERPSINFCQLSVRPGDLPSTSINFLCSRETYC